MKSLKAKFRKTDANEWNKNDERLLAAVEHGEAEKVASLLAKKGTSPGKLDTEGKSALHVAASRGQIDCLSVLLAHGADPSITDAAGFNPLHLAARNNHVDCCRKLIQKKCPVDIVDGSGKTSLHHAAASGKIQTVQLLCELKSPVDLKDADGLTPLHLAAQHDHAEACATLLDGSADVNAADNSGRTALMIAAEAGAAAAVEVLVQRGANLAVVDSQGHDAGHYARLPACSEVRSALVAALSRQQVSERSPRCPLHDQVAKLSDERITTPKKRKAPPPPISPLQRSGPASSLVLASETLPPVKSNTPERLNYKGDRVKEEFAKLHEERNMLLETIEDLKQTVEQTTAAGAACPELDVKANHSATASSALVSALQAKIAALTVENQQLASKLKTHPSFQGNKDLNENSRPDSMASNSSFHSTQDELESTVGREDFSSCDPLRRESVGLEEDEEEDEEEAVVEEGQGGSREEIQLLRQALESVQLKLQETSEENRSLLAQLRPEGRSGREKGRGLREEELIESLAELQAKLTDTQERYHQAVEEVHKLSGVGVGEGGEQRHATLLEQEVKLLRSQLVLAGYEQEKVSQQVHQLEEVLRRTEEERQSMKEKEQRIAQVEEMYNEAQEEVRALQEALKGAVPVEAAAHDFEEMKSELSEVITGLQRRLVELSHSYSETKVQLCVVQKQLAEGSAVSLIPSEEQKQEAQVLSSQLGETQASLADAERKLVAAQEEISLLRQEAEAQAQSSVALTDHTQVMSSLGNAIKELENQTESLKEQLQQKTLQVDSLQSRLAVDVAPDESIPMAEHKALREQLEGEMNHLTQLLQEALRKQDEMALEAADAWQQARENSAEREALQELLMSREKENQTLTSRIAESQDSVCQLKQLVENHVASEREKNKRIDDLSREVGKLKDALNSLSQLSYSSTSPSKRQQQSQQLETLQQQVKQLQYQLAESKKQHNEIVSVYRMHLLYAVQGQMDEDVQKALKQILMMCKMPSQAKDTC